MRASLSCGLTQISDLGNSSLILEIAKHNINTAGCSIVTVAQMYDFTGMVDVKTFLQNTFKISRLYGSICIFLCHEYYKCRMFLLTLS